MEAQADLQAKLEVKEAQAKQVSQQTEQRVRQQHQQQTEENRQANNALNELLDELDGQYDPAFRNAAVDAVSERFANDPVSAKDAQGNFLRSDEERYDWIRTKLENEYMRQKLAQETSASTPEDKSTTDPDTREETQPLNAGSGTGSVDENAYSQIKPGSLKEVRTQLERKWAQEAASG